MSKNRVIVEAVLAGQSHGSVARQYGVSKVWVGKLVARWREHGWDGLEPRSRAAKTNPNTTPPDVVDAVLALRAELTALGLDAGAQSIAATLTHRKQPCPSVTTIWRILTRAGVITPSPKKRPRSSYTRFEADLPNECWQADFTHWPLIDGTDIEILCFIDDHSRFAISLTAHQPVNGATVLKQFQNACNTHGIPASTLTDNGLVFTARARGGRNSFERELVKLGIEQKNGRPNHPQTQGKVERFQQTLKKWLKAQPGASTIEELQTQLDAFTTIYNHNRPHRSLAGRTPADAYTARAKATPQGRDGHWRIRDDKVDQDGHVTLRHASRLHHIGLGRAWKGMPIRMLIHDLHITVIATETGEIIRDFTLDPTKDHQPRGIKNTKPKPPEK